MNPDDDDDEIFKLVYETSQLTIDSVTVILIR